jgi:hypothetical protein
MIALFFLILGITLWVGRTEFAEIIALGLSRFRK